MDSQRFAGHARLYAGSAPLFVALPFLPVIEPTPGEVGPSYGSLSDMVGQPNPGPAVRTMVVLFALLAFLVAGAFRPDRQLVPAGIAITSAVLATRVLTKGGIPPPSPDLADAGTAGAALAIATTAVALVHLWHPALLRERRSVAALSAGPDQPGPGSPGVCGYELRSSRPCVRPAGGFSAPGRLLPRPP